MKTIAIGLALMLTAGCATMQQRVGPYPAYGQTFVQQQRDDRDCWAWAQQNAAPVGESMAAGTAGGALVGAALGAGVGALAGAFFGMADTGAAIGASVGGVNGAVGGAGGTAKSLDDQREEAYRNCMASRGYTIGGVVPPRPAPAAPAPAPTAATTPAEPLPPGTIRMQ